jgi:hypothetical protein
MKRGQDGSVPKHPLNDVIPASSQNEILARLKSVETRGSMGDTCVMGGNTFASEIDVRAYITTYTILSCAIYWDLFSILV